MKKAITLFLTCFMILALSGCSSTDYDNAIKLFDLGNYLEAKEAFSSLGDYKDAVTYVKQCDYKIAKSLFDEGKIDEAKAIFLSLGDFEDAKVFANQCDYLTAKSFFDEGKFDEAKALFLSLGNYEDANDYAKQCDFKIAELLKNQGKYEEAIQLFETLGDMNGCEESIAFCKYYLGKEAMQKRDWNTALSILSEIDFGSSKKMITDCQFMITLKESIQRRMESTSKEQSDLLTLVNTELAYLEKYREDLFYNPEIRKQAKTYINGLDDQLESFDYEYYVEHQLLWQQGLVKRYEALNTLYEKYDFMADSPDFVGTYVSQLSHQKNILDGYNAIIDDIAEQYKKEQKSYVTVSDDGSTVTLTLKNNTSFTFSSTWEFTFTDENDTLLKMVPITVTGIKPGQPYIVEVFNSDPWDYVSWVYSFDEIR